MGMDMKHAINTSLFQGYIELFRHKMSIIQLIEEGDISHNVHFGIEKIGIGS